MRLLDALLYFAVGLFGTGVCGAVMRLDHGRCDQAHFVNGVRPDGRYGCRPIPRSRDCGARSPRGGLAECDDGTPDTETYSYVYCTGGSHPIVVDERTVGCQR